VLVFIFFYLAFFLFFVRVSVCAAEIPTKPTAAPPHILHQTGERPMTTLNPKLRMLLPPIVLIHRPETWQRPAVAS
jgi:hypothetical protein